MLDERYYLLQVDKLMDKLRAACLGQNTPLTAILPEHMKITPPEERAAQLAEQILFALVRSVPGRQHAPQELASCRKWLRGTALYLLKECAETDHTFAQWRKLLTLPHGARTIMFADFDVPFVKELQADTSPTLLKEFDVAVLGVLNGQKLAENPRLVYQQLSGDLRFSQIRI